MCNFYYQPNQSQMKNIIPSFKKNISKISLLFIAVNLIISCNSTSSPISSKDFTVKVHIRGNVDNMNTVLSRSAIASEVLDYNVHSQLLERDPATLKERPFLVKTMPEIKETENGGMALVYEIREEAVWDDGSPILASDYVFTIKVIKNPQVQASSTRAYLEFIEDIIIDENNPKKFTIISNKPYFGAVSSTGGIPVLPAYFYDAEGLMSDFSIAELNDPNRLEELNNNPRIKDFATAFNNNFSTEPSQIMGAGAYQVKTVSQHEHIILERKEKWWGDAVDVDYIKANPKKIIFKIIDNDNTAIAAIKEQKLDVFPFIDAENFLEIKESKLVTDHFALHTQKSFSYYYIGFNMKNKKLNDVRVRKAFAHLVDISRIINDLKNGMAVPVHGPVSPLKKHYNKNLKGVKYNLKTAAKLLAEAGWKDTNGDNVLDKMIKGRKVELELEFLYAQGKIFYSNLAKILKDEAERVGIKLELNATEWASMQDKIKERDFELTALGWGGTPTDDDFTQVWHSKSNSYDGSNSVGFGNQETDALIEKITITIDDKERTKLYQLFQEKVVEQQPYVFLMSPTIGMAVSKKIKNPNLTAMRPGYMVRLFEKVN